MFGSLGRIVAGAATLGASELMRPKGGWGHALTGQVDYNPDVPEINAAAYKNPYLQGDQNYIGAQTDRYQAMGAPQMSAAQLGQMQQIGGPNLQGLNGAMGQNSQLAQMLMAQANGTGGPSVAEQQMNRGLQQNIASQMAMAGSMPGGGNAALMGRNMQNNIAGSQLDTTAQAGILRAQEQMGARNSLAQVLMNQGQMGTAGAELGQRGEMFNAGALNDATMQQGLFNQQAGMQNQNASLQQQALNNTMSQYLMGQRFGMNQNQFAANQGLSGAQQQRGQYMDAQRLGVETGNAAGVQNFLGGVIGAGGALATSAVTGGKK